MTCVRATKHIVERDDGENEKKLPIVIVHDTQIEQLLRRWETEREVKSSQPTHRPTQRRETYGYD